MGGNETFSDPINPLAGMPALHEGWRDPQQIRTTGTQGCKRGCVSFVYHYTEPASPAHREKCMVRRSLVLLVGWLLLIASVVAQDVPPALRDWQGWVLHDVPQHGCPVLANPMSDAGNTCIWPGRLALNAGKDAASFSLGVHVDAPSWVALPGGARNWPQQVNVNRQSATVLQREDQPMLWLTPGDYQVTGMLPWTERPAQLRVPTAIGLVTLAVDGDDVTRVERNGDQLTLGEAAAAKRSTNALAVRVYRKLHDGLPATLETRLQLTVTGSAREQLLGPALPAGFTATALAGDLPARLENDGRLRVQLRPGQWTLTLSARSVAPLAKVTLVLPPEPWPRQETWSYADANDLRGTQVQGSGIDAAQAGVPDDWAQLPAFALNDDAGLAVEQGTRGDEANGSDQLHLQRQLWLDFDGNGFSVADQLTGVLRHPRRLDVAGLWQLQRASQDSAPLLITRSAQGHDGVELREQQLQLGAGLRLPAHAGKVPAAGWQLPLESIDATLHLPHGYRLLGASGADRSPDSWIAQWSLLDMFVVALVALLAGRLLGWPWALLAGGYLVLAQHENIAPLWTLAVVLALGLMLRALPQGRLQVAARMGALAVFILAVLWTLPFAAAQLQSALHPQLEDAQQGRSNSALVVAQAPPPMEELQSAPASPVVAAPAMKAKQSASVSSASEDGAAGVTALSQVRIGAPVQAALDTHSVIQAGAGTPAWDEGNNYRLGWSGPVTAEQTTNMVIVPAWLVRLLRVVMVVLLAGLLAKLAQSLSLPWRIGRPGWRRSGVAGAALLALAFLPHVAHAQSTPSQPMLDQLRTRLTEAPPCAPSCAELALVQLQASGDALEVVIEAHAGTAVALPLPQADEALQLQDVMLDGHANVALTRLGGQLLLRLDRGVHRVTLRYRIGAADSASLRFALHPQRVEFLGQGWSLDGVDDGRVLGDSVALNRTRNAADGSGAAAAVVVAQSFPPYVRLTRRLTLGVDWSVENTVERIAPQQGGFSSWLPLLPGEHPLGEGIVIKDGRIGITFNANSNEVSWNSRLDHAATLALKAPSPGERAEVWQIDAAAMWHVDASGVPTSASDEGLRYQPLPGESLQLAIQQPAALAGDSLAFDHVSIESIAGDRAMETTLSLVARSTRGGEHAIDLPRAAQLLEARRDGESINLALRDGKLSVPLLPGTHAYTLRVREPQAVAPRMQTPTFALHAAVANIDLNLALPHDRWVLWTWGPPEGPAVLYWSQLVVLLLGSWLLARYAPTPLRFHHWLLLGLGFSAFAWSAYALVVVWLIVLGLRSRVVTAEQWPAARFNLMQAALAAITVLALGVLVSAVPAGLLGSPDMHVAGHGSHGSELSWFADRSAGLLPAGHVLSVSIWVYKLAMLAWALWLASALIRWLRWGFDGWTRGGYWRRREPKPALAPPPLPASSEAAPDA